MEIKKQTLIEENENTRIYFSEVSWNKNPAKKEIRKWLVKDDGSITALKGVTFNDDSSLDRLTEVLVDEGYGDKNTLMSKLSTRPDKEEKEESPATISTEDILESIRKDDE